MLLLNPKSGQDRIEHYNLFNTAMAYNWLIRKSVK